MLRQLFNEAQFDVRITSQTPMLINGGISERDVDMSPVRTRRPEGEQPYIPGSSAKGVIRSHAERIARTLAEDGPGSACNPFHDRDSCSKLLQKMAPAVVYANACPVCKLFGCLSIQSRLTVSDFYSVDGGTATLEKRDGVGINRVTGGASNGALFNLEVAVGGAYDGVIRVRNFEIWQLGLLAFVLRDLREGALTFGMAKSRGLGQVKAQLQRASIRLYDPNAGAGRITGLAALGDSFAPYGFYRDAVECEGINAGVEPSDEGFGFGQTYGYHDEDAVVGLLRTAAPSWPRYVRSLAGGKA